MAKPANAPVDTAAPSVSPPADATRSETDLAFKVLRPGKGGPSPKPHDKVTLHFVGWDETGKVIEDSRKRGFASTVKAGEVMPGWAEALRSMTVGETRRLWLKPGLGYKARPGKPARPVVFDLELVRVETGVAPVPAPADVAAAPADAKRTDSGLAYKQLAKGKGHTHPRLQDVVYVNLVAWTADGKNIENSATNGAPVKRIVKKGLPGLVEGLQLMVVGDKHRFWIPHELAHKHYPGVHRGMLVYDVEVVSLEAMPDAPPTPKHLAPPAKAKKTASSVPYQIQKRGKGPKRPGPKSKVLVHSSSWDRQGVLISSTQTQGQPIVLKMHKLMVPLRELLQDMAVGERRHAWLREDQMFLGNKSDKDVVVELEMIEIR